MEFWKNFWEDYRNITIETQSDLFYQVGKTKNKLPINKADFENLIEDIIVSLQISKNDVLLELCCGNGLITKIVAQRCKEVYAFDFTKHLIDTAQEFNADANIFYTIGNAKEDFFKLFPFNELPNKFLFNDALAYFTPADLKKIIETISNYCSNFELYVTNVPLDELKYNFYNTPERVQHYEENLKNGDFSNNGIGRWWSEQELISIAEDFKLHYKIQQPDAALTNFRINILYKKN